MPTPKEVRIALVMGGGVSLGSFSGGAVSETLRLLEDFPGRRDGTPIAPKIDVVSGASAGSMTLAMLIRYLLSGDDVASIETAMKSAWCEGVGLDYDDERQLTPSLESHTAPSLLSSDPIWNTAATHLKVRSGTRVRPHALLGSTVYASFAVSNLHGIDVRAPWQLIRRPQAGASASRAADDSLVTTFHNDRFRFKITPGTAASGIDDKQCTRFRDFHDRAWSRFKEAAIASGAFPAAFPPVKLKRKQAEYQLWPEDLKDDAWFEFAFVDGGLFRNEPLREAIELARIRDAQTPDEEFERVFLFIDPHVSGSHRVRALDHEAPLMLRTSYADDGFVEEYELIQPDYARGLLSVLGRVATMVSGQAAFRDWIKAAKLNRRVAWSEGLTELAVELAASIDRPERIAARVDRQLKTIYNEKKRHATQTEPPKKAADRKSVRSELQASFEEHDARSDEKLTAAQKNLARDLVLLTRNVSGLRRKRHLNLVAITPWTGDDPPLALAGNFLANFGGFFKEAWRQHDFEVGRYAARYILSSRITDPDAGTDANRLIRKLSKRQLGRPPVLKEEAIYRNVSSECRDRFENFLHNQLENIAGAAGVMDWVDDLVARKIKDSIVKSLRAPHAKTRYIVLRLRGIPKDYYFRAADAGPHTDATRIGNRWVLETVCALSYGADRASRYDMHGPHVQDVPGSAPEIWVYEDEFGRDSRRIRMRLLGDPREWYERAERSRLIDVNWNGRRTQSLRPANLAS